MFLMRCWDTWETRYFIYLHTKSSCKIIGMFKMHERPPTKLQRNLRLNFWSNFWSKLLTEKLIALVIIATSEKMSTFAKQKVIPKTQLFSVVNGVRLVNLNLL